MVCAIALQMEIALSPNRGNQVALHGSLFIEWDVKLVERYCRAALPEK